MDTIFSSLTDVINRNGGDVVKLAGDLIICLVPARNTLVNFCSSLNDKLILCFSGQVRLAKTLPPLRGMRACVPYRYALHDASHDLSFACVLFDTTLILVILFKILL